MQEQREAGSDGKCKRKCSKARTTEKEHEWGQDENGWEETSPVPILRSAFSLPSVSVSLPLPLSITLPLSFTLSLCLCLCLSVSLSTYSPRSLAFPGPRSCPHPTMLPCSTCFAVRYAMLAASRRALAQASTSSAVFLTLPVAGTAAHDWTMP